jgi:hypothetical protein
VPNITSSVVGLVNMSTMVNPVIVAAKGFSSRDESLQLHEWCEPAWLVILNDIKSLSILYMWSDVALQSVARESSQGNVPQGYVYGVAKHLTAQFDQNMSDRTWLPRIYTCNKGH